VAFERVVKVLPKSFERYLSPGRYGLRVARNYVQELLGNQRLVAVDVGAAHGILPHWHALHGIACIYQIEPRDEACAELGRINAASSHPEFYRVVRAAVAGTEGPRTLYVSNAPTGTSLFPPDFSAVADAGAYLSEDYFFPIVEQTIETRTLRSILDELSEARADLIKLDIQGAELEALQGLGDNYLNELLGGELEIGMTGIYPEAANFGACQEFMISRGFDLFDVRVARAHLPYRGQQGAFQTEIFSTYGNSPTISARIWEFDAVYFRRRSLLLAERNAEKIRRMAVCYLTYNFFAEAFNLIEGAGELKIFSEAEASHLRKLIVEIHRVRESRPWLGNNRFWRSMRRIGERVAPRSSPRWCQYMYQNYPSG
jgi:FkbM family methyltransferase